ncbi:MAG TPA: protein-disulfide reductase DsbD domain-containing protein [Acetobacteraceae bacterium]|nr:protein-disulfide reductase DsbD domain-containing protein [Acetobacteraceae bacterium]
MDAQNTVTLPGPVIFLLALLATALPVMRPAVALESAPVTSARDVATLVSDTDAVTPGTPFRVGLRIRLAPGWHTYWRNPGDAGVAPDLTLDLPAGASAGPIEWPAPQRVAEGPLMTYAYTGEVLLPITVTPPAGAAAMPVEASATWLVCKEICVPEQGRFRLDLPAGPAAQSPQAPLFATADAARPIASPWQARIAADGRLWVRGAELNPGSVANAWLIPARAGTINDAAVQTLSVRRGGIVLGLSGVKPGNALSGLLTVVDRAGQATTVDLTATPGAVPEPPAWPLARTLALAFLGGLILNLMPCVFPVLAMKAIGLAETAAHGRARSYSVSYTLGVLATFGALGGALVLARAAGAAGGWGFQFQSPAFVAGMSWVLLAVGLNLSGVFELGGRLAGAGQGLAARGGHLGSFFTGLLAVLVATPCTAPFMGAAIAAGLAAPVPVTLLVFLMMGIGLAAPYVVLAEIPGLTRVLPHPGRWMERLRQVLAFPMYAAAAWLLWVISQEAGPAGVLGTLAGALLVGFAAWVLGATQTEPARARRFGQSVAAVSVLVAIAVLTGIAGAPPVPATRLAEAGAEPFSTTRLATLRTEGRPVFVDMTAAWCVTCLINERVAIATPSVRRAFAEHRVAYLMGDWTRQDPAITAFLRAHGRDGVPLYMFFPPGHGPGVVLPQILTEGAVLARLEGTGG